AQINDIRVERVEIHLHSDLQTSRRELVDRRRALSAQSHVQQATVSRLSAQLVLLDTAAAQTLSEIAVDAAWGKTDAAEWQRQIGSVAELEARTRAELLEAKHAHAQTTRELTRLRERMAATANPTHRLRANLELSLQTETAGLHQIEIEYVVPNACWRPQHRATLSDDEVWFESEACLWQNSGEDWPDVQLRLSTQRPSLGASPPELETDQLEVRRRADQVRVETRQQVVQTTGLGQDSSSAAPEMPGINDGGEVQEILAPSRTSVASDGRPHRTTLFEFRAPARSSLVCTPELSASVLRKTEQENLAARPLLAGPVDLIRGGGLIGRTTLLYVAPRERFALGWGPDPALRVHRQLDESEEESKLLSSWYRTERSVTNKLSNLGGSAKTLELVERVPVSEIDKVKIEVERESSDKNGMVRWTVTLDPFGQDTVKLRYVVSRHSDVSGDF
ncbi:MAG TPA: mucoidy inhibitor MuiA family protein, partial [Polyangiaceae bacterium]|nr:mucoidy inhibitor MuiA family protein [Polyangiaceae bacterium]